MGYEGARKVIGSKWTLEILDFLTTTGPVNYTELETNFSTSSDIVTSRLQLLQSKGFIDRQESSPKDVTYEITDRGQRFLTKVQNLESTYDL